MAISQNSRINRSDIYNIFTAFNNFIASFGGSIAQIPAASIPAVGDKVDDANIATLNAKINAFKADEYLKTKAWWTTAAVSEGKIIYASDMTNINTTVSNFSKVKCRNKASNAYGKHTHCCNSNAKTYNCSHGKYTHCCNSNDKTHNCSHGKYTHCCNSNDKTHNCAYGKHTHCCNSNAKTYNCSHGKHTNCCNSNANSHVCSVGTNTHLCSYQYPDTCGYACAWNADGCTYEQGYPANYVGSTTHAHGSYSIFNFVCFKNANNQGSVRMLSNSGWPAWSWSCTYQVVTVSCGAKNCSHACQNTASCSYQDCGSKNCGQTCQNTASCGYLDCGSKNCGQTCQNTASCSYKDCGSKNCGQTCQNTASCGYKDCTAKGTAIDITCSQTTKTNSSGV